MWREEYLCGKLLNIKGDLNHKRIINSTNVDDLKYV
jgi:hypothetical protein